MLAEASQVLQAGPKTGTARLFNERLTAADSIADLAAATGLGFNELGEMTLRQLKLLARAVLRRRAAEHYTMFNVLRCAIADVFGGQEARHANKRLTTELEKGMLT
jgi:hypothetical protein